MELNHLNFDKNRGNYLLFFSLLFISIIIITPLFSIILSSLKTTLSSNISESKILIDYLKNSFQILFFVIVITLFFGVIPAFLVSFFQFKGSQFFKYALILSLAIPPYIYGYSLSSFLENYGTAFSIVDFFFPGKANEFLPDFSPITLTIISLSFSLFGYIYLLSLSSFSNQLGNYIEISKTLGFSKINQFTKIIFPLARPAIFVGLSLVAMETLSDFGTVSFFGVSTFTTGIYNSWFIFDDIETANFLSLLLLFFIIFFFLLENKFQRKKRFHYENNNTNSQKIPLKGFSEFIAILFCFLIFFFSFIFPILQMLFWTINYHEYINKIDILNLNLNTFYLIFSTSLLLIVISFFCNYGIRVLKSKLLNFLSNLSISGYAIPGILISIAVVSLISVISDLTNINLKTIFIGSFFGLIIGYIFRFYSIAFNGIKSNYLKIHQNIDESGYLIGLSKLNIFFRIHLPILKENTFFIFILIALEIIKELPITLILRPFNFSTFSTKAYDFASQDLIEAASVPSLFLVFWATIFILISSKYFLKK